TPTLPIVSLHDDTYFYHSPSLHSSFFFFFFYCSVHHPDLHSFPTRRSSDLFSWTTLSRSEQFVAQIMRALDLSIRSEPNRSNSRSEEHTSELQSRFDLVCRLLLEKKKKKKTYYIQTY